MDYIIKHSKLDNKKKNTNGEVFTPPELINDMLDKLPIDVWSNPNLKFLDPCAGIANFTYIIFERLNDGLKDVITDEDNRKRHILKNMIYMVELDATNCGHIREVFKGYSINLYEGSFLDYDKSLYDVITINPPYQELKEGNKKSKKIWHYIMYRCYECLNEDAYLLSIHPCGWRDIKGVLRKVFEYNMARNLIYLNMNSYKAGNKYFKCCTNFDYYLLQNKITNDNTTLINDYDGNEYSIDLNKWEFIPNGKFKEIKELIEGTNDITPCNVLHARSEYDVTRCNVLHAKCEYDARRCNVLYNWGDYECRRNYMSRIKDDVYNIPIVYMISKNDGIKFYYSSVTKGHIGIPKVIWGNGTASPVVVDKDGEYGLTQYAYAIIDDIDKLDDIKRCLDNPVFIDLMSYCIFGRRDKFNYKVFTLLKKDFYKAFC